MNGDLRVAYRASREGPRDIVFVPNWFTCCEVLPELPSIQGWVEAMTSLGRLIFFDQPGTGASDPVTPGALPTLEQWADSITAVLDDLGSREAVLLASRWRCCTSGAVCRNTSVPHHRAGRARGLYGHRMTATSEDVKAATVAAWGTGEMRACDQSGYAVERRDPGSVGTTRTPGGQPRNRFPLVMRLAVRIGRAGGASDNPRAHPRPPPRRRPVDPARRREVRR